MPLRVSLLDQPLTRTAMFALAVQVAECSDSPANLEFFSGLISGAAERESSLAKDFVRAALQSPKLKTGAISLIGSGPLQIDDIVLLISLLKSKDVQPWQCASLSYGRHLSPGAFLPLLEELKAHGYDGLWTVLDIISMYLNEETRKPTAPLIRLLKGAAGA